MMSPLERTGCLNLGLAGSSFRQVCRSVLFCTIETFWMLEGLIKLYKIHICSTVKRLHQISTGRISHVVIVQFVSVFFCMLQSPQSTVLQVLSAIFNLLLLVSNFVYLENASLVCMICIFDFVKKPVKLA